MDGYSLRQASAPNLAHSGGARRSVGSLLAASEAIYEEPEQMQPAFAAYERSSSVEARGPENGGNWSAMAQQPAAPWDRCNSADGADPTCAKQLASAVEDKLKLAPILAKRLERVSHSSGSFSSRQSVVPNQVGPSGRNTPQRLVAGSDYSKLNYLVTSLEGVRGERNLKVEGSARLPQVVIKEQSGSPTTSRNGNSHSFDEAKRQVDRDLHLFLEDVRDLYAQISHREGADVPIVLEVIASIMDMAEECLETPIEDFKLTITDIVDNIEPSDFPTLRHQSQSSDLEAFGGTSDGGSVNSGSKKKKSLFNKLSKGLKNFADGFKRKSSNVKDKESQDGAMRMHSESQGPHVRFRVSTDQPPAAPSSPSGSRRVTKVSIPEPADDDVPPVRKLDNQRSVRFKEAPVHIIGESEDGSGGGASGSAGGTASVDGDTGKRAKLMVETDMPRNPMEEVRTSASPQQSSELAALGTGRAKLFRRASVDLYAMGLCAGLEPMSPDGVPPEDLTVICSICEEAWLSTHLEEHSIHCAVLRTLSGNGLSVDAQLTTIANVLEEWLETPLAFPALGPAPSQYHVKNQLIKLIKAARNSAALQPDGSKVPTTRCFSIQAELAEMLETAARANKLAIVTQTYAHRVMRLISEKVNLLAEPFGGTRVRAGGGSDAGDSGTSTPRSMPGMSIEEFEIIKPISRGAFGRVYLARKLATGDLFAIKVMKKKDLIRKNMVESVTNERNILAMAQNPFVVRFYYSFTSRENLYIVMEYINGGDCYSLLRKIGAMDEEVARQYIAETVLALEYCHAQGIIHRDLKPDNLLINAQGHVKLTDFGLSCVGVIDRTDNLNGPQPMDTDGPEHEGYSAWGGSADANGDYSGNVAGADAMDASKADEGPNSSTSQDNGTAGGASGRISTTGQPNSVTATSLGMPPRPIGQHQRIVAPEHEARRAVGTPDYLAPELLLGTGHGPEVDWWALGAILYEFVTGTPPFNADTPEEIFDNILDRRITWPDEDDMSAECRDLIDKLLHPNPLKRLGHRGAGEVKLHSWFEGLDWTGLVRNKAAFIPTIEDETDTSYFESKHVSQRSMMEDLDKLRSNMNERSSAQAGPSNGPSGSMPKQEPGSGPPSGAAPGRTQVDRLKDQYHREGSGLRSVGSSNSHGSSHMSRTSYTGANTAAGNPNWGVQLPASHSCGPDSMDAVNVARTCSSPGHPLPTGSGHLGGLDSGTPGQPNSSFGRNSGSTPMLPTSALHPRNSTGSSCGGPMAAGRNSGSGARHSGSCQRNSSSGPRASISGSAGMGGAASERPSPGSVGAGTMSGITPGIGDGTEGGSMSRGGGDMYGTDLDEEVGAFVEEEGVEEGEEEEGVIPHEEDRSRTGSGDDTLELTSEQDPFGNFSFTNFTGLSAANMEKIQKLREHFNRRTSYSGPGTT
ncbi:hypothetical protein GPECTOR_4g630 [Gonium pectorale]|uniref:non-specific serine/threonine protein kinase n=1 Tax=Gonium pectorale TaxID=33097 RepID=A0A150GXM7_GONPE|nr:hypothetical protein GPECTOR_4g630 [Gonium pectorale]|eukprot:KXZ54565.1 hypothetical protein GPECTOR_4g630 [Gonium pectorale]